MDKRISFITAEDQEKESARCTVAVCADVELERWREGDGRFFKVGERQAVLLLRVEL